MVSWLLYPFIIRDDVAQDAVPMVVAADLAGTDPDAVYPQAGGIGLPDERFKAASCKYFAGAADCDEYAVSFVSPPLSLPLVAVVPRGSVGASLAFRIVGAAALVATMAIVWRATVGASRRAAWSLLVASVLLLPFVAFVLALGQTSPLLVLAAALPLAVRGPARGRLVGNWTAPLGVVMALAGAFKVFPLLMLAVPAARRHWRPIVAATATLAVLGAVSLVLGPASLWGDFAATLGAMRRGATASRYNSSFGAAARELGLPAGALAVAGPLAIGAIACARRKRLGHPLTQWAVGWVVVLLAVPQVWGHYGMVAFVAVAVLVARDRGRGVLALPVSAALLLLVALVDPAATGAVTMRLVVNLAQFALVLLLASRLAIPSNAKASEVGVSEAGGPLRV